MILTKIKEHAGKLSFFFVSVLIVVVIAMYIRQQDLKKMLRTSQSNAANLNSSVAGQNGSVGANYNSSKTVAPAPSKTTKTS